MWVCTTTFLPNCNTFFRWWNKIEKNNNMKKNTRRTESFFATFLYGNLSLICINKQTECAMLIFVYLIWKIFRLWGRKYLIWFGVTVNRRAYLALRFLTLRIKKMIWKSFNSRLKQILIWFGAIVKADAIIQFCPFKHSEPKQICFENCSIIDVLLQ